MQLLRGTAGADAVELGSGTGYVSAWLARRGARPIGVGPTDAQLRTARLLQHEFDLHFPLVLAAGEQVPLRSSSFDLVISEYGAAIWADPYRWIPEAARLLRPGGELVFLGNSLLLMLWVPDEDDLPAETALLRPQFDMHRFSWPDSPAVEFHIAHAEMIRLLRAKASRCSTWSSCDRAPMPCPASPMSQSSGPVAGRRRRSGERGGGDRGGEGRRQPCPLFAPHTAVMLASTMRRSTDEFLEVVAGRAHLPNSQEVANGQFGAKGARRAVQAASSRMWVTSAR